MRRCNCMTPALSRCLYEQTFHSFLLVIAVYGKVLLCCHRPDMPQLGLCLPRGIPPRLIERATRRPRRNSRANPVSLLISTSLPQARTLCCWNSADRGAWHGSIESQVKSGTSQRFILLTGNLILFLEQRKALFVMVDHLHGTKG